MGGLQSKTGTGMQAAQVIQEEYRVTHYHGKKWIVCNRLDMLEGIDEELLQGTVFTYKCASERESALKWKEMYESVSKRQFTIMSSKHKHGLRSIFLGRLGCVHRKNYRSTRKTAASARDIGCPAGLILYVRTCEAQRSKRPTAGGHNLRVYSNRKPHNHVVESALKYRRPGNSIKAVLLELFDQYHTPASALEILKLKLLEEHGDDYLTVAADRALLPDKGFVSRIYYETYHDRYGNLSRKEVRKLQERALRHSAVEPQQNEPMTAVETLVIEQPLSPRDDESEDGGDGHIDPSFDECEQLPDAWFASEVCHGEVENIDVSPSQSAADSNDRVSSLAACDEGGLAAYTPGRMVVYFTGDVSADAAGTADATTCDVLVETAGDVSAAVAADLAMETAGYVSVDAAGDASSAVAANLAMETAGYVSVDAAGDASSAVAADLAMETAGYVSVDAAGGVLETVASNVSVGAADDVLANLAGDVLDGAAGNGPPVAAADSATAAGPTAETMVQKVSRWAVEVSRQISADNNGQWRDATAAFLENWERLPVPGRLAGLQHFGRSMGWPARSIRQTGARTETVMTQTELSQLETDTDCLTSTPYIQPLCVLRKESDWDEEESTDEQRTSQRLVL